MTDVETLWKPQPSATVAPEEVFVNLSSDRVPCPRCGNTVFAWNDCACRKSKQPAQAWAPQRPNLYAAREVNRETPRAPITSRAMPTTPSIWSAEIVGGGFIVLLSLAIVVGTCSQKTDPETERRAQIARQAFDMERVAKARVSARMKDPGTVQFQDVRTVNSGGEMYVCGRYNAKNGFGAYNGFKTFIAAGAVVVIEEDGKAVGAKVVQDMLKKCQ